MLLCAWAWHQLGRFYDLFHSLGIEGCMLAAALGWWVNRWGLQLSLQPSEGPDCRRRSDRKTWRPPPLIFRRILGGTLQLGGAILTSVAMLALVRTMVA